MKMSVLEEIFKVKKPIIGMVHLPPLPGSPLYRGEDLTYHVERAVKDAKTLEEGGVDGYELENMGDMTYYPGRVGPETVASMTYIANQVSREVKLPFGICVLTDPVAAVAVAHVTRAAFVRATVYTEAVMDVSGVIPGCAHELQRFKKLLGAEKLRVFADIQIKHSVPLSPRPIEHSAIDAVYFLADAVIVSGTHTGEETPVDKVRRVKEAVPEKPVLIGSGTRKENVRRLFKYADGAIVGTSLKANGKTLNPVDITRVREFMKVVKEIRGKI